MVIQVNETIGTGTTPLTLDQKKERKKLMLGSESIRVIGMPNAEADAIELLETHLKQDYVPSEIINNLSKYPKLQGREDMRIVSMKISDDGSSFCEGIKVDGKENDPSSRTLFGIATMNDLMLARLEVNLLKKGVLKEVSERTLPIHADWGTDLTGLITKKLEDWNNPPTF